MRREKYTKPLTNSSIPITDILNQYFYYLFFNNFLMKTDRQIVWVALALLLIFILIGPTQKANDEWQSWKEEFGIEFGSPVEEMYRRRIF